MCYRFDFLLKHYDSYEINLNQIIYYLLSSFKLFYFSVNTEILNMQLQNQSGQSIDISKLSDPNKRPKLLEYIYFYFIIF